MDLPHFSSTLFSTHSFFSFVQNLHSPSFSLSLWSAFSRPIFVTLSTFETHSSPPSFHPSHFLPSFVHLSSAICLPLTLQTLDAVHPPSSPFPSPFVSHPLLELYSRHPNPICYQPSLISLPLNNVNPRNFGISIDLSAIENCHCVFY